ncbi:MAG TPA: type II secretion system F family protein [Terriglobales bacterium]|nr:type II secretion system F family protein [Terriglobales bacterium]
MAEYLVKVADERGHVSQQVENARSEAELRERFSQQGLLVYEIKTRGIVGPDGIQLRRRRIKLSQFVIFNQQFVTLIHAGLPILNALDLLIKRQKAGYFRSILQNVRDRVKSGELLSDSFAAQGVFPKIYTTTLLAGEKSGNLEEVLTRYVHFQRMAMSFRKKLTASLIYPALLVVLVVVMLTFLVTYVVPQFANLYEQLGTEVPALTEFMLSVGTAAQKYFFVFLAAVAAAIFAIWRLAKSETGSERIDRVRVALPGLGAIWLKYQVAVFARMMATLLSGGLPLVPALETAAASIQSRFVSKAVGYATQKVREGRPLSRSLEETNAFPELTVEMLEVGESTGALPTMLTSVAEFYEEDVQNALTAAMSLIEPAILIVMGTVVAFVLISLYLPIFTLGAGGIR